jgi:hypothetical protein
MDTFSHEVPTMKRLAVVAVLLCAAGAAAFAVVRKNAD